MFSLLWSLATYERAGAGAGRGGHMALRSTVDAVLLAKEHDVPLLRGAMVISIE